VSVAVQRYPATHDERREASRVAYHDAVHATSPTGDTHDRSVPPSDRSPHRRPTFTVLATEDAGVWLVTVLELPDVWTYAYARAEIEPAARMRIALDLACDPVDVDVRLADGGVGGCAPRPRALVAR